MRLAFRRKNSLFLLAILAAAMGLASCAGSTAKGGVRFLIGVSQANLTEPWRVAMTEEIRQEAAFYPDMKLIYTDAGDSSNRQIDDVHKLLAYGIDLLIISPTDSQALTPVVREVYSSIPVIVVDRAVVGYDYSLFIGPDNERLGREAGKMATALLGGAKGNILEIEGRLGSPPALDRDSGFRKELDKVEEPLLLKPIMADWLRDEAEDKLTEALPSLPSLKVIFAQNDAMAYGAWKACSARGLQGISFIGIDGLPGPYGGIDLVQQGILSATFTYPTGGKAAIIYGRDLLLKKSGIPKQIFLRPHIVTGESLAHASSESTRRARVAPDRPIVLGFAQVGAESEWRVANTKSIKEAAAQAGINLLFEDGRQKQENEIAAIRSFIRQKVDVISFSPIVESGWDEVLQEARAAGIPVILSDRTVNLKDDYLWLSFLGSDFAEEGRRAARWLLEEFGPDHAVNIVELQGTIGSAPAIDRTAGFRDVLKTHPSYRIIASEGADFLRSQGYETMKEILRRPHPAIDAVFAHNDDMALGAIQALEEAGLKPGSGVKIVSIDAAHGAFVAMIQGKLNCTVECNPLLGPELMKAVKDYMNGKDLPLRMITSEGIFTAATARRDLAARSY